MAEKPAPSNGIPTSARPSPYRIAADSSVRVKPLTEGYIRKGGVNTSSRITERPPAPAPMRPASPTPQDHSKPSET